MNQFAKKLMLKYLSTLSAGQVIVRDQSEEYSFGQSGTLSAGVKVNNSIFYRKVFSKGVLGAAQSFIDGDWHTEELTSLIRIMLKNQEIMSNLDRSFNRISRFSTDLLAKIRSNTIKRSREYIHAHYDLGNDFFKTFMDDSLMYSCAIFNSPDDSLETAQLCKMKTILDRLDLQPGEHVLEIGTGWGSLAIMIAEKYQCEVTTTTISEQQYAYVKQRIERAGLQSKIHLLKKDYRLLEGQFDKIVSIEMIEAVGHQFFDDFFRQCDRLLKPKGLMAIQAITMNEQTYDSAILHVDFIKKYIFPGGCLPSVARLAESVSNHTKFQWIELQDIGLDYVKTLQHWHQRFIQNIEQIRTLGYSEEFIRMWQYYFCYCEAGFAERYISDIQVLWRKRA